MAAAHREEGRLQRLHRHRVGDHRRRAGHGPRHLDRSTAAPSCTTSCSTCTRSRGYDFSYQSAGGEIWSGQDWYENSAGLLLTETTLADTVYTPSGTPVFVRAREAAQYDATVAQAVHTLVHANNGAYSNEWLIGDSTGTIASLQLGGKVYDLHETKNGFFGSSNFDWGTEDAGRGARPRRRLGARRLQRRPRRLRALPALGSAQDRLQRQDRRGGRQDHGVGHLRHLPGQAPGRRQGPVRRARARSRPGCARGTAG